MNNRAFFGSEILCDDLFRNPEMKFLFPAKGHDYQASTAFSITTLPLK
jgi:hypothetical protein